MDTSIPSNLREALAPDIETGEVFLWAGRPELKTFMWHAVGPTKIIALPFFAVFVIMMVVLFNDESSPAWFRMLAMSTMSLGIVAATIGTWFYLRGTARQLVYAVSDRRVIMLSEGKGWFLIFRRRRWLKDFSKGSMEFLHVVEKRDGSGHIYMSPDPGPGPGSGSPLPALTGVPNVRTVAALIRQQEYAPPASAPVPFHVRLISRL